MATASSIASTYNETARKIGRIMLKRLPGYQFGSVPARILNRPRIFLTPYSTEIVPSLLVSIFGSGLFLLVCSRDLIDRYEPPLSTVVEVKIFWCIETE